MSSNTQVVRISATISEDQARFLDEFQVSQELASRSAALGRAIEALREQQLLIAYKELGEAQRRGTESYPDDNADGLDQVDTEWR